MRWVHTVVAASILVGCGGSAPVVCTGDVNISSSADWNAFAARGCASVTGTLTLLRTDVTSVNLPALDTVGNLLVSNNAALTSLSLPALTKVNGYLVVDTNGSLTSVSLPLLTTVSGRLLIIWSTFLTGLSLPVLTTVGGDLAVDSNLFLPGLSLPALTGVSGTLGITNSRFLTNFNLPALTTVGVLDIWGDPALPQCLAIAFKDHLVAAHGFAGPWTISGNDMTATCP
jgi:hypothetical protein